ncbi:hypothetical protein M011DRAFT_472543 [Sporormia fimetaria CBS 119925]|uniref:EGF-like domain-containing protein n=1 Tax=Sporormia fimetaria CBS 119925 TaxID=1340428 RepID=A0A6A6UXC4_9PLEO|nr:hypothetical protein M011DRAFT_472543 [Sporormia fimetaria CBS 119925]
MKHILAVALLLRVLNAQIPNSSGLELLEALADGQVGGDADLKLLEQWFGPDNERELGGPGPNFVDYHDDPNWFYGPGGSETTTSVTPSPTDDDDDNDDEDDDDRRCPRYCRNRYDSDSGGDDEAGPIPIGSREGPVRRALAPVPGGFRGFTWPRKEEGTTADSRLRAPEDEAEDEDDGDDERRPTRPACPRRCLRRRPTRRPTRTRTRPTTSPTSFTDTTTFVTETSVETLTTTVDPTAEATLSLLETNVDPTPVPEPSNLPVIEEPLTPLVDSCPAQCDPSPLFNRCDITSTCVTSTGIYPSTYYCMCGAGFRADFDPTDSRQFRVDNPNTGAYVRVASGVACNKLCDQPGCTEVPVRNQCL